MKLITRELPRTHQIVLFGDNHRGSVLEHRDGFLECIEYIGTTKNCFGIHMSDAIEGITITDPRFDLITTSTPPSHQISEVISDLWPIRKKLITMLEGNHERKLSRTFGDISKDIAERLGIPYGTYTAIITLMNKGKQIHKIFAAHGYGSINSTLDNASDRMHTMKRSLRRKLQRKAGDCLIMAMGHTHKLIVVKPENDLYITSDTTIHQHYVRPLPNANYIPPNQRWYVNTGSFLKLYGEGISAYAECAGYDPLELGFIVIHVNNGEVDDIERVIV